MPILNSSGSPTLTLTSETTLATISINGTFALIVDTSNMINGDTLEIRWYYTCLSAGVEQLAYVRRCQHVQSEPMKFSIPIPSDISCRATLNQVNGSAGRQFPWKILQL